MAKVHFSTEVAISLGRLTAKDNTSLEEKELTSLLCAARMELCIEFDRYLEVFRRSSSSSFNNTYGENLLAGSGSSLNSNQEASVVGLLLKQLMKDFERIGSMTTLQNIFTPFRRILLKTPNQSAKNVSVSGDTVDGDGDEDDDSACRAASVITDGLLKSVPPSTPFIQLPPNTKKTNTALQDKLSEYLKMVEVKPKGGQGKESFFSKSDTAVCPENLDILNSIALSKLGSTKDVSKQDNTKDARVHLRCASPTPPPVDLNYLESPEVASLIAKSSKKTLASRLSSSLSRKATLSPKLMVKRQKFSVKSSPVEQSRTPRKTSIALPNFLQRNSTALTTPDSFTNAEERDRMLAVYSEYESRSWLDTVDRTLASSLSKSERKRWETTFEIIQTEAAYVRQLNLLDQVFFRPLQSHKLLKTDEILRVLPNLQDLLDLHEFFYTTLKTRWCTLTGHLYIGDLITAMFGGERGEALKRAYAIFCSNQKRETDLLKVRIRKDSRLSSFMSLAESEVACRRLKFSDIIASTYQRITRYPLLINRVLEATPETHPDYLDLVKSVVCCRDIVCFVNNEIGRSDHKERLDTLLKHLDCFHLRQSKDRLEASKGQDQKDRVIMEAELYDEFLQLNLQSRQIHFEGDLVWEINNQRNIPVHVVLFDGVLILPEKREKEDRFTMCAYLEGSLKYKSIMMVHANTSVKDLASDDLVFLVISPEDGIMVKLRSSSSQQKIQLMSAIKHVSLHQPAECISLSVHAQVNSGTSKGSSIGSASSLSSSSSSMDNPSSRKSNSMLEETLVDIRGSLEEDIPSVDSGRSSWQSYNLDTDISKEKPIGVQDIEKESPRSSLNSGDILF